MPALAISGIYRIRNLANGKQYIGSSVNISVRWAEHRRQLRRGRHPNKRLQNAWNKYGESAFAFEVIEEGAPSLLLEREQHYLDTEQRLYNIALYADAATRGRKLSPEHVEKVRQWRLGHALSPEARAKISATRTGKKLSSKHVESLRIAWKRRRLRGVAPETLAKMSAAARGKTHTPESRKKIREARLGSRFSDESRAKMSAAAKARWQNPEYRARTLVATRCTDETRAKMKAAVAHRSPETLAKMSAAHMGHKPTPESRARMSMAQKARRARAKQLTQGVLFPLP